MDQRPIDQAMAFGMFPGSNGELSVVTEKD